MGKITNSKDLIMILLYAKGHKDEWREPIVGKTRLTKMIFLFEKEIRRKFNLDKVIPDGAMPEFEAHNYGPFSSQVYHDLEYLVDVGLVEAIGLGAEELLEDERREYEYWQATSGEQDEPFQWEFCLTEIGREFVKNQLSGDVTKSQWNTLGEFKKRCTSTSLRALLKYVYSRYPETTTKSTIRDEILGR